MPPELTPAPTTDPTPSPTPTPTPAPSPAPASTDDGHKTPSKLLAGLLSADPAPADTKKKGDETFDIHDFVKGRKTAPKETIKETAKAAPASTPPAPAPAPAPTPMKRRARATPPPPAPTPSPVAAPDPKLAEEEAKKQFRETLIEEERDQLELAELAEKKDPKRHAGLAKKTEDFLKWNAERTAAADFDPEDPAYLKEVETRMPKLPAYEIQRLVSAREADRVREEMTTQNAELRHDNFVQTQEPAVKAQENEYFRKMATEYLPPELSKLIKEKGVPELLKNGSPHKVDVEVAQSILTSAASDVAEFIRITTRDSNGRPMKKCEPGFNADGSPNQHQRILMMIEQVGERFGQTAGAGLVRGNQSYLPRGQYYNLPPAQRAPYFTLSDKEVLEEAIKVLPSTISTATKMKRDQLRQQMEAYGFINAPAAPAATPPPVESGSPPAPRPSLAPVGGGSDEGEPSSRKAMALKLFPGHQAPS